MVGLLSKLIEGLKILYRGLLATQRWLLRCKSGRACQHHQPAPRSRGECYKLVFYSTPMVSMVQMCAWRAQNVE